MDRGDVERLFHILVAEEILREDLQVNKAGYTSAYVRVGRRADLLGKTDRYGEQVEIVLGMAADGKKIPTAAKIAAGKGRKPRETAMQKFQLLPTQGKPFRMGKQQFIDNVGSDEDEDEVRITKIIQNHISKTTMKGKASTSKRGGKVQDSEDDEGESVDGPNDEDGGPDGGWTNENDDDEFVVPDGEGEETAASSSNSENDEGDDSDCELVSSEKSKETWKAATQTVKAMSRGNDPTAALYEELKACVERVSSSPAHQMSSS